MTVWSWITGAFLALGLFFFLAGTLGLLRFPDVYMRLHAMTKADNVGLGLICIGLMFQAPSLLQGVKLALVWLLVLLASTTAGHLVARSALRDGMEPWKKP